MFSKLAGLIVISLALAAGAPQSPVSRTAAAPAHLPAARLSLCLGPVVMGFAASGDAPLTLRFKTSGQCRGFAGLVQLGASQPVKVLKTRPSNGGFEQKLPSLVPPRH